MNIAELKAWIRGMKWIRKNLGKQDERREEAEFGGAFVYYVVEEDTNIRKSSDGVPIIYATREAAEDSIAWREADDVISVADYNRMYARFMIEDGE